MVTWPSRIYAGALYLSEVSVRAGYHAFSMSNSWRDSYAKAMKEDLFFRDESFSPDNDHVYYSDNVNASAGSAGGGYPVITLEYMMGIKPESVPLLDSIETLQGFRGIRAGVSLSWYPVTDSVKHVYHGSIIYHNSEAIAPEPADIAYTGTIALREELFILAPSMSLAWFHENGVALGSWKMKLVPFAGLEAGMAIVSGSRKITMTSDLLHLASTGQDRRVSATIQESFFNGVSLRTGLFAGGRLDLGGGRSVELRAGWIRQETPVTMNRSGSWSETIDGATYTRRVHDESRSAVFSQTGFLATIGYSQRLR
ncbi:MAG: hypothetical protein EPN93_21075 [Spirochaetes bacterium]|nr:MAG: hypothetical protein EPN93_21075 [Spirochaetota bacterium]